MAGSIVRRLILSEASPFIFPEGSKVLYSEVVVNGDDEEILELWLAVPNVPEADLSNTTSPTQQTIYTNTVVHDEDSVNPSTFAAEIENSVNSRISEYNQGDYDDND